MKITLKQVEKACTDLNTGVLRETWYGVEARRHYDDIAIHRKARRPEKTSFNDKLFVGSPKECMAYLAGIRDWVTVPHLAPVAAEHQPDGP